MNVHDAGAASAVDVMFSGVRLFFDSRLLNPTKSTSSIVFHPLTVAVNSLQPDSQVSISALVGGMSMPFCVSGPRTVLKIIDCDERQQAAGNASWPTKPSATATTTALHTTEGRELRIKGGRGCRNLGRQRVLR